MCGKIEKMKILILFVLGVDESGQLGAMLKVVERHFVGDSLNALNDRNFNKKMKSMTYLLFF